MREQMPKTRWHYGVMYCVAPSSRRQSQGNICLQPMNIIHYNGHDHLTSEKRSCWTDKFSRANANIIVCEQTAYPSPLKACSNNKHKSTHVSPGETTSAHELTYRGVDMRCDHPQINVSLHLKSPHDIFSSSVIPTGTTLSLTRGRMFFTKPCDSLIWKEYVNVSWVRRVTNSTSTQCIWWSQRLWPTVKAVIQSSMCSWAPA